MTFEIFQKDIRTTMPKAILRRGQICLNAGAVRKFSLKNNQYFMMGYDKERKAICLRPIPLPQDGCRPLFISSYHGTLNCKLFLDYFNIPQQEKKSFDLKSENDMLVFEIKNGEAQSSNTSVNPDSSESSR